MLYEEGRPLYVGQSRNIRNRLKNHWKGQQSAASLAVRIAQENIKKTDSKFPVMFAAAQSRIRAMRVRYVDEANDERQYLLEFYAAIMLNTLKPYGYNSFRTH